LMHKIDNQITNEAIDEDVRKKRYVELGSDFVLENPEMLTFQEDIHCNQQSPVPSTCKQNTILNMGHDPTAVEVTPYPSNYPIRKIPDTMHHQSVEHNEMMEFSLGTLSAVCCATNSHLAQVSSCVDPPDEKSRQEIIRNVIDLDKQLEKAVMALGEVHKIYENVSRSGLFHKSAIETIDLGNTYKDVRGIAGAWKDRRAAVEQSMASMLQEKILGNSAL